MSTSTSVNQRPTSRTTWKSQMQIRGDATAWNLCNNYPANFQMRCRLWLEIWFKVCWQVTSKTGSRTGTTKQPCLTCSSRQALDATPISTALLKCWSALNHCSSTWLNSWFQSSSHQRLTNFHFWNPLALSSSTFSETKFQTSRSRLLFIWWLTIWSLKKW